MSQVQALPPAGDSDPAASPRRWWTLTTVALAQLMVALDSTVANIALPSAQHDLGFSSGERQWVITAYSLAFGSPLLLGGQLSDVVGPKRTFMAGLLFRRRGRRRGPRPGPRPGPHPGLSPGPARHSGPEHRAGRGPFR